MLEAEKAANQPNPGINQYNHSANPTNQSARQKRNYIKICFEVAN